ncbi:MAG: hypothetical protein ACRC5M_00080 [Anaeroplasmataceae bacterium]
MCVWTACGKNVELPKKEERKLMWQGNPDGAGVFWTENNTVKYAKGFMKNEAFEKFLSALEKRIDLTAESVVLHYRISTTKSTSRCQTHPFPITNDIKKMGNLKGEEDVVYCHNGSMNSFYDYFRYTSDTMNFGLLNLSRMKMIDKEFYKKKMYQDWIEELTSSNKDRYNRFCFLDKNGEIHTVGDVLSDESGRIYSNKDYEFTAGWVDKYMNAYYDVKQVDLLVFGINTVYKNGVINVLEKDGSQYEHYDTITRTWNNGKYAIDKSCNVYIYDKELKSFELVEELAILDDFTTQLRADVSTLYTKEDVYTYKPFCR